PAVANPDVARSATAYCTCENGDGTLELRGPVPVFTRVRGRSRAAAARRAVAVIGTVTIVGAGRDRRRRRALEARFAIELVAGTEDEFALGLEAAAAHVVVVRPAVILAVVREVGDRVPGNAVFRSQAAGGAWDVSGRRGR